MARPKKNQTEKKIAVSVTLEPDHLEILRIMGEGNLSGGLDKVLSLFVPLFKKQIEKNKNEAEEILN